ncbi:hypothetical protein KC343_g3596 [Hortaea werneckii]|nr:hypothetical protein KC352_g10486 [Hortaea werneckii]KAI7567941.1 hypothetical protein KC317_g4634 [Hortaea werneckii]KAI7621623.1 hypothetical protein KC346_g3566 [Hortaea werneckii]KAI7632242.1 hypothetical protein KC343_g3596 [Hortaea werneckii]KAI7677052.1 hypothetical protein KC319_g4112 [Hortaea werneckii]
MIRGLTMLTLIIALLVHQATSSNFQCPDVNNLIVQDDYGVQYVVSCGTDADPGAYDSSGASNSWNDCFQRCSTQQTNGGPCNGFTYSGAYNGRGSGTCYYKGGNMRFIGSGSGLISVSTPERCPGCNIAGYANGTSPRSSSVPGTQTVSVTYTTIQTRTETATRYSTNTITTTGTVTTTAVSSYYTTATTTAVSTSRETLTTTTVQTTTQPGQYSFLNVNRSINGHFRLDIQTNTRTQTQLTTVTYVSTQPTTVVSTYVSTQTASTNTATITQRTTLVSTYQTTSVVTQTQTSTAPGIHGRANTDTTNHGRANADTTDDSPRDQCGTRSYTDDYISAAGIHDRANANTTDHCPRDQRSARSHTDGYIDPTHDLCLDLYDLFPIYDDIARCNHHYCFLGDIDLEYYNCVHYYNYNPGDSNSAWHDHPGDNDTAWRNSNLRPDRFGTYGHLHYSQHQLWRRVRDLCDPNSCVCPNVEQLRASAIVFGIDSIGFSFGFSHIIRRLVCAVTDIFLGFSEFLH